MYQLFPSIRGNVFKVCWKRNRICRNRVLHGGSFLCGKNILEASKNNRIDLNPKQNSLKNMVLIFL